MMNHIIIVGRLVRGPELEETENGNKVTKITLAVPRNYKNNKGEYDKDFIDCVLWRGVAENTAEYCKKGDVLGVKGRFQTRFVEKESGKKEMIQEIIAERVTFLSSKSTNKNERCDERD